MGSSTTDRKPNDVNWLRRAIKKYFTIRRAIFPKPSLRDEIAVTKLLVGSQFVHGQFVAVSRLGSTLCMCRIMVQMRLFQMKTRTDYLRTVTALMTLMVLNFLLHDCNE